MRLLDDLARVLGVGSTLNMQQVTKSLFQELTRRICKRENKQGDGRSPTISFNLSNPDERSRLLDLMLELWEEAKPSRVDSSGTPETREKRKVTLSRIINGLPNLSPSDQDTLRRVYRHSGYEKGVEHDFISLVTCLAIFVWVVLIIYEGLCRHG